MAVNITTVLAGAAQHIADVEATADGDTTATIPHGLGVAPLDVHIVPLQLEAVQLSEWFVSTIDATNVVLTKETAAGSGVAGDQLRVVAALPHTIVR